MILFMFSLVSASDSGLYCVDGYFELSTEDLGRVVDESLYGTTIMFCDLEIHEPFEESVFFSQYNLDKTQPTFNGRYDVAIDEKGYLTLDLVTETDEYSELLGYHIGLSVGDSVKFMEGGLVELTSVDEVNFQEYVSIKGGTSVLYLDDDYYLGVKEGKLKTYDSEPWINLFGLVFTLPHSSEIEVKEDVFTIVLNEQLKCNEDLEEALGIHFIFDSLTKVVGFDGCNGKITFEYQGETEDVVLETDGEDVDGNEITNTDEGFTSTIDEEDKDYDHPMRRTSNHPLREDDEAELVDEESVGEDSEGQGDSMLTIIVSPEESGTYSYMDDYGDYVFELSEGNNLNLEISEGVEETFGNVYLSSETESREHLNICGRELNQGVARLGVGEGSARSNVFFTIDGGECVPSACDYYSGDNDIYSLSCSEEYPSFQLSQDFGEKLSYSNDIWNCGGGEDCFNALDNLLSEYGAVGYFDNFHADDLYIYLNEDYVLQDIVGFKELDELYGGFNIKADSLKVKGVRFSSFTELGIVLDGKISLPTGGVVYDSVNDLAFILEEGSYSLQLGDDGLHTVDCCGTYDLQNYPSDDVVLVGCEPKVLAKNKYYDRDVYVLTSNTECEVVFAGDTLRPLDGDLDIKEEKELQNVVEKYYPFAGPPKVNGAPSNDVLLQAIKGIKYDSVTKDPSCCGDYLSRLYTATGYNYRYESVGTHTTLESLAKANGGPPLGYAHKRPSQKYDHALMLLGFDSEAQWWVDQVGYLTTNGDTTQVKDGEALTISFTGDGKNTMRFDTFPKSTVYSASGAALKYYYPWFPLCNYDYNECSDEGQTDPLLPSITCKADTEFSGYWDKNQAGAQPKDTWSRYWVPTFSPYYPNGGVC